ncbi:MAG: ATP-binding protein [Halorientalis sp.]
MGALLPATVPPLLLAHVLVFGGAAVVCFASVPRTRRVVDADTRRGLAALLVTSGGWAAAQALYLLVPTAGLKLALYQAGLVVGLATVGPWLYFCSAYTGRTLHRAPAIRRAAVAVFLAIVLVKLTNPLHHLYFRPVPAAEPFRHLAMQPQAFHWVVMGLAYALATVGYFMLFEVFWRVNHDTRPFFALVGVTALPVVLDVAAFVSPALVDVTYEPLGVAIFAVGVLFVLLEDFQTIRLAGESDDPIVVLSDDDRVRDYNDEARDRFPALEVGADAERVLPAVAAALSDDEDVVALDHGDGTRYFQLSVQPFTTDVARLGRTVTLTDVTEREQYRRELERQNERLDQFASMVAHDLRNPLNVAQARVEFARQETDSEHLETAETALDRMESLIADVLALAREGEPIEETQRTSLSAVAENAWGVVETGEATLTVADEATLAADPARLQQLFENLFRNAIDHGGSGVALRVGVLADRPGFYVADDGPGVPAADRETVFEFGYTTDEEGTGFGLAIVGEIAEAHGWDISVTDSWAGGARFEITGVESLERGGDD